jgi:hypothetical protein
MDKFKKIFEGLDHAHGVYIPGDAKLNGKLGGKSFIKKEEITDELWETHLKGEGYGLGIIPINKNNECRWGCIDIDLYTGFDHKVLLTEINKKKLPMVICRSKSGGAHVFLFTKEFVSAKLMQYKLKEIAALLGYAESEIFPKQIEIKVERGDTGNFLNLPYYGGDNTTRYAILDNGDSATLEEFISLVEQKSITIDELREIKTTPEKDGLEDFPPCLQILCRLGVPEGNRNNFLYNMGVALKKKNAEDWENELEEMNRKYNSPPLNSSDVIKIIGSLTKKDYKFTCKDQPVVNHCNSVVCKTRKYGIGDDYIPEVNGLRKLLTDPPLWFLNVSGQSIRFTTEELLQQPRFQSKCTEHLDHCPLKVTERVWNVQINTWLSNVEHIAADEDAGDFGEFKDHLEDFCVNRGKALDKSEIQIGKPYIEGDKTYFQLKHFQEYLRRKNFKKGRNIITAWLKDLKAETKQLYISKGKNLRVIQINSYFEPKFDKIDDTKNKEAF